MQSLYLLGIALGGGILAVFISAGLGSYKEKKIPEKGILFRWFVAGLVAAGLCAYAWIFGSGGDVAGMTSRIVEALDLGTVTKLLSFSALTAGTLAAEKEEEPKKEQTEDVLEVGIPTF
jgi:hypothetical protein